LFWRVLICSWTFSRGLRRVCGVSIMEQLQNIYTIFASVICHLSICPRYTNVSI
jgi:hypothetical protein